MHERFDLLKQKLEGAMERHRDAYNQALGGLHVLEELQKKAPDALTEEQLGRALGAQTLSFEPVKQDGKNS